MINPIRLQEVLNSRSIYNAALRVANRVCFNRSKGLTRGSDGLTYWEFAHRLDDQLRNIISNRHNYYFSEMLLIKRRLKSKVRDIYISNWRDKIVEIAVQTRLNALLSSYCHRSSFAYRPDRIGIDQCQSLLARDIKKMKYIIRRDISNYFYTIDHDILIDKLKPLCDQKLLELLIQRIKCDYIFDGVRRNNTIGVPFGSSLACVLANVYLTDIDYKMSNITYYRYADDIIFGSESREKTIEAAKIFDEGINELKLDLNRRKCYQVAMNTEDDYFESANRVKFLGIEFDGRQVRLPIEKRRKIINFYKCAINMTSRKLRKGCSIDDKLRLIIGACNEVLEKRIRSVALIDYYLSHVNDELQLKSMDRQIAEMVISAVLAKKFRKKDFNVISYQQLRTSGLASLLHRSRLLRHDVLRVPFMSLFNKYYIERYEAWLKNRSARRWRSSDL